MNDQPAPTPGNTEAAAAAATGGSGGQPQGGDGKDSGKGGQQQPDLNTPKFTQSDYNRFEANLRREYQEKASRDAALIEKGKQVEAQEREQQPVAERLQAVSAESAQKDTVIADKDLSITRLNLAWEAGLPPAIGRRVQGKTVDEIKADIEDLKRDMAAAGASTGHGGGLRPNPQQGAPSQENNRTGSVSAGRDLWAQRHGKKENAAH